MALWVDVDGVGRHPPGPVLGWCGVGGFKSL